MNLLALDTATENCSVALGVGGGMLARAEVLARGHGERLPGMVAALLAEAGLRPAQLDGLAVGIGPGSFAGVRVGVAYAKGLALALGCPVIGVSSLLMLAEGAALAEPAARRWWVAIDARMDEVYLACYRRAEGGWLAEVPEAVLAPAAARDALDGGYGAAGSGWRRHGAALEHALGRAPEVLLADQLPDARAALRLAAPRLARGEGAPAAHLLPAYLRNRVALTLEEQRAGATLRGNVK